AACGRARHRRRRGRRRAGGTSRRALAGGCGPHRPGRALHDRDAACAPPRRARGPSCTALSGLFGCGARGAPASVAHGGRSMIATVLPPRLRRAVSSYTGIVRTLDECLATSAEPRLYRATCEVRASGTLL